MGGDFFLGPKSLAEVGKSRTWPTLDLTIYLSPRYLLIVFAFAGDSTMTSDFAIKPSCCYLIFRNVSFDSKGIKSSAQTQAEIDSLFIKKYAQNILNS